MNSKTKPITLRTKAPGARRKLLVGWACLGVFCALLILSHPAQAADRIVSKNVANADSIKGGGRNIMRTAEGALICTFVKVEEGQSRLYFGSSADDGKTWYTVVPSNIGKSTEARDAAVDSNFNGAYMAFVEKQGKGFVGRVIYSPNPLAPEKTFVSSDPGLTPNLAETSGSFIAATRDAWGDKPSQVPSSVVYGWAEANKGDLYVGVSPDGKTFPPAKKVYSGRRPSSSPAVTIRGDYVFLTFITDDPNFAPADLPKDYKGGRQYPVWMESRDVGKTWSKPLPLFGLTIQDFPKVNATEAREAGVNVNGTVFAAGGSPGWNTSTLVWSATEKLTQEEIIFATNAMAPVTAEGPFEKGVFDNPNNLIGIVSFRKLAPDSKWTHVVANRELLRSSKGQESLKEKVDKFGVSIASANTEGDQHQYSALIDTPVRATTYIERGNPAAGTDTKLVVVSSIDTGKVFDHFASFTSADMQRLGISHFDSDISIKVSQCLFEDRDGEVYVDVLLHDSKTTGALTHAKVPLRVNTHSLSKQMPLQARK